MTAICAGHYHNPLNDHYRVGRKHYHQNRFRPRQSTRSAFYKPGFTATTTNKNTTTTNNNNNDTTTTTTTNNNNNNNNTTTIAPKWNFRPSALQYDDYGTGDMSVAELVDLYVRDNERAAREGVVVPKRPSASNSNNNSNSAASKSNTSSTHGNTNANVNTNALTSRHTKVNSVRDALFSTNDSSVSHGAGNAGASPSASPSASGCSSASATTNSNNFTNHNTNSNTNCNCNYNTSLRCLQWNIQAFTSPRDERNLQTITAGMIRSICETDSDVLVLNEIHWRDMEQFYGHVNVNVNEHVNATGRSENISSQREAIHSSQSLLERVLASRGYRFLMVAQHGDTPTMVATRKTVLRHEEVVLSNNRSALCVLLEDAVCGSTSTSVSGSTTSNSTTCSSSSTGGNTYTNSTHHSTTNTATATATTRCWIVGTHLDAFDAEQRRSEIRKLLASRKANNNDDGITNAASNHNSNHNNTTTNTDVPVIVMGDFNQQRANDYTPREWNRIAGSARLRNVPLDDGVSELLETRGFRCVLDDVRRGTSDGGTSTSTSSRDSNNDVPTPASTSTSTSTSTVRCNWNKHQPPPSTHWSGTTIDYTYYYSNNDKANTSTTTTTIAPHGVYVGSAGFSDHRMTVTDWTLTTTSNAGAIAIANTSTERQPQPQPKPSQQPQPSQHIDKDFFFRHLPAGRHHSWLYAVSNTNNTYDCRCDDYDCHYECNNAEDDSSSSVATTATLSIGSSSSSSMKEQPQPRQQQFSLGAESLAGLFVATGASNQ